MKRESKIGDSHIITISDNGMVSVPSDVRMSISEIASLFGIYYQTAKKNIRSIEKSGIATGDDSMGSYVERMKVYPDYYGLEMIIALAFRIRSYRTEIFRNWMVRKLTTMLVPQEFLINFQSDIDKIILN